MKAQLALLTMTILRPLGLPSAEVAVRSSEALLKPQCPQGRGATKSL